MTNTHKSWAFMVGIGILLAGGAIPIKAQMLRQITQRK